MNQQVLIGTSGWLYPSWIGSFYPERVRTYEALTHYATRFPTTEINTTFYHFPRPLTFQKCRDATPDDFIFSLKLNQFFTHELKLEITDLAVEKLESFLQTTQALGPKLGALLVQTPPSLRCDKEKLEEFIFILDDLKSGLKYKPDTAFEFRHESWQDQDVYDMLSRHNIAWVITHSSVYPCATVVTADFLYLRFHGPTELFSSAYGPSELTTWAEFVKTTHAKKIYAYFNNTANGDAPEDAAALHALIKAANAT